MTDQPQGTRSKCVLDHPIIGESPLSWSGGIAGFPSYLSVSSEDEDGDAIGVQPSGGSVAPTGSPAGPEHSPLNHNLIAQNQATTSSGNESLVAPARPPDEGRPAGPDWGDAVDVVQLLKALGSQSPQTMVKVTAASTAGQDSSQWIAQETRSEVVRASTTPDSVRPSVTPSQSINLDEPRHPRDAQVNEMLHAVLNKLQVRDPNTACSSSGETQSLPQEYPGDRLPTPSVQPTQGIDVRAAPPRMVGTGMLDNGVAATTRKRHGSPLQDARPLASRRPTRPGTPTSAVTRRSPPDGAGRATDAWLEAFFDSIPPDTFSVASQRASFAAPQALTHPTGPSTLTEFEGERAPHEHPAHHFPPSAPWVGGNAAYRPNLAASSSIEWALQAPSAPTGRQANTASYRTTEEHPDLGERAWVYRRP